MEKYLKEFKKEEKKTNFFSSINSTAIAIDVSGSTSGEVMENQKKIISNILSGTNCEGLKNNIIAWDNDAKIKPLQDLTSYGWTDPSVIFNKLGQNIENLVVTTDGEISTSEVDKTRDKIKAFNNLKNIICLSFQNRVESPGNLNIAVFYPFLEHTKKMKGSFYLFFYKDDNLYLLLKNNGLNSDTIFKSPPLEYTSETKWEEIPKYDSNALKNIIVTSIKIEEGYIYIPNTNKIINLNLLEKDVLNYKNKDDLTFVSSDEFNEFMNKNINNLIDACVESYVSENFNKLRNIVSEWKKALINKAKEKEKEKEKDENIKEKNKKIELYQELTKKKLEMKDKTSEEFNKLIEQLKSLSKEIFSTVKEKLNTKVKDEYNINKLIGDIQERITEEQNKLVNNEVINDFTLKNITKVANRVKRATKLNIIESADNWDLSGNPLLCDECLICTRNDQPMALLMIDLSVENPNLLEFNVSDFSLNDELNTGTKNTSAIPSGEFCVECAYAMMLMGKHPITRQKIGSVLVLADPTIQKNNKMILNSICCSMFGGREIKYSFQILLGLFDELEKNEKMDKSENRFSPKIYEWIYKYILYNTKANLLTEEFGKSKILIEAMLDVLNYNFSLDNSDTWLIPLRNKTIKSMSIIVRSLLNENKDDKFLKDDELKIKAISFMRRIFIKNEIISKVISICKNKVNGKNENVYNKMCYSIENDLFDNDKTSFPIMGSEKICSFENSKMIKALCRNEEEYKDLIKSIKYFEAYIKAKYKNDTNFEFFSNNMITIITMGIYLLTKDENNINDLCKAEEDTLLGFLGVKKIKNNKTDEEKKIIELNKNIFINGNTKEISELTKEKMVDLIKSISMYAKIKIDDDVKHIGYTAKFASHLFSPSVTKCSFCGASFITDEEISNIKNGKNVNYEEIKSRKYAHFQKYFFTTSTMGYNENSNLMPLHKTVRKVCTMDKFKDLERPTKEVILEEINYLKKINRKTRGNVYESFFVEMLVKCTWDFLQRRKNLSEEGKKLLSKDILSFEEKIKIEINEPQDNYLGIEAGYDGLTEEEIKDLTTNINLNSTN